MSKLRHSTGSGRAGRPGKTTKFMRPSFKKAPKTAGTRGTRSVKRFSDHDVERAVSAAPARRGRYDDRTETSERPVRKTREQLRTTTRARFDKKGVRERAPREPRMDAKFGVTFGGRNGRFKKDFIGENQYINKAVHMKEEKYVPTHYFHDFAISDALKANLAAKGYTHPSPIQDQAIPVGLTGKDIIGIAATGTGKTAAFLIPIIEKISKNPKEGALILAPTRELAVQIENEFKSLTKDMKLFSVSIVGGMPMHYQIKGLKMGVHIAIGTPGRVKDLVLQGKLKLGTYKTVVLDEADRMMDMGFIDDMKFILGEFPEGHQSMFFSATFDEKMQSLCHKFLTAPKTIQIKSRDTAASVEQNIVRYDNEGDKFEQLKMILKEPFAKKVIVFTETKASTEKLESMLRAADYRAVAINGDKRNRERQMAVEMLASGKTQSLIATDVAARGIDIKDVSLVINYDTPNNYETYIHRIGRTGRAGATGHALTFIPPAKRSFRGRR